ncbi:hypothetical protein GCM10028799_77400 [Kribbella italica]
MHGADPGQHELEEPFGGLFHIGLLVQDLGHPGQLLGELVVHRVTAPDGWEVALTGVCPQRSKSLRAACCATG